MKKRCEWVGEDLLMLAYHDKEWGVPLHDDRDLFEFLSLEGAQAGLSWSTILKKREHYKKAFDNFNTRKMARYTEARTERLLKNPGIVRNRLKVAAARGNARAFLEVQAKFGSFDAYIWQFTKGKTVQNRWKNLSDIPATTSTSESMSQDLKKRGFKFVGSTICYAFMQAVGMVNDHTIDCFRYPQISGV